MCGREIVGNGGGISGKGECFVFVFVLFCFVLFCLFVVCLFVCLLVVVVVIVGMVVVFCFVLLCFALFCFVLFLFHFEDGGGRFRRELRNELHLKKIPQKTT